MSRSRLVPAFGGAARSRRLASSRGTRLTVCLVSRRTNAIRTLAMAWGDTDQRTDRLEAVSDA